LGAYRDAMHWDPTGVWVLMAAGCLLGIIGSSLTRFSVEGRPSLRQSPLLLVEACLDVVLTGLGIGMGAVFLVLLVAQAFVALHV
jgi:hypothetical protein